MFYYIILLLLHRTHTKYGDNRHFLLHYAWNQKTTKKHSNMAVSNKCQDVHEDSMCDQRHQKNFVRKTPSLTYHYYRYHLVYSIIISSNVITKIKVSG